MRNSERRDIVFAEGHCYTCNKLGHKYWECPESQVSGDSRRERSESPKPREGKVRFEKESNKESQPTSPKKEPKSYAFFSQEVAVTVENPQKRVKGERSQPSSNMMGNQHGRRVGDLGK